ncbi:hypothetical protein BDR05DRAFT_652301 [Suillus weaverae]|nr:hypothetical protein BDR05DRAFT_652301 [Suillus weaverae]
MSRKVDLHQSCWSLLLLQLILLSIAAVLAIADTMKIIGTSLMTINLNVTSMKSLRYVVALMSCSRQLPPKEQPVLTSSHYLRAICQMH